MFNRGDNIAFNEAESTPTFDLVFFSPKKKLLESYQTKADTYGPESLFTPKSPAFFGK